MCYFTINLPSPVSFLVVLWEEIYMKVIIGNVSKDTIPKTCISQIAAIQFKQIKKMLIRNRKISSNLRLMVLSQDAVNKDGDRMTKHTEFCVFLLTLAKPTLV